jgi:hypothetical protein
MKRLVQAILFLLLTQPIVAQTDFSQENATHILKTLCVEIGPRPMGSPAEQRAMKFAVDKFREYGCDTSYVMPMEYTPRVNTTSGIAIGVKRGATKRIILIGGHMDSAGPEIPGADDDGSGAATVIELARVLGARRLQSTIVFCCWGGEEQGLEGSRYFVDHYSDLDSVGMMLQVDMANGLGVIDIDPDTHSRNAPQWLVRATIEEFHNLGYKHLRYPWHYFSLNYAAKEGAGSDHESFLREGIPAVDLSTDVNKPIHTPRDNFENCDPRGMKRTGDVFLRLVERFDAGTPNRRLERYWLLLIGSTPIFVPFWAVWAFMGFALAVTIAAFIAVWKRREPPDAPGRIRWSGLKMLPLALIIVVFGWFSPDLIGVIKGIRFAWYAQIPIYYVLAGVGMLIGAFLSFTLSRKFRMTRCPYVFFKRAAIILVLYSAAFSWLDPKIGLHPAMGLLLLSLGILIRQPVLKLFFMILSPVWMLRLIFSEWDGMLFRSIAPELPVGAGSYFMLSAMLIGLCTLYLLPIFYGFAAILRDSDRFNILPAVLRSRVTLSLAAFAFCLLGIYLAVSPSYDALWHRNVGISEDVDLFKHTTSAELTSSEYLTGLRIHHGGFDTTITDRSFVSKIIPRQPLDTTWLQVQRTQVKRTSGDTVTYNLSLLLHTKLRPYTVTVTYTSGSNELRNFSTQWRYRVHDNEDRIEFYSFPDTMLTIPVMFTVVGKDSVKEKIDVIFSTLAYPIDAERDLTYFIPRTSYHDEHVFNR